MKISKTEGEVTTFLQKTHQKVHITKYWSYWIFILSFFHVSEFTPLSEATPGDGTSLCIPMSSLWNLKSQTRCNRIQTSWLFLKFTCRWKKNFWRWKKNFPAAGIAGIAGMPACRQNPFSKIFSKHPWKCGNLAKKSSKKTLFSEIMAVIVNDVDDVIIFADVPTSAGNDVTKIFFFESY